MKQFAGIATIAIIAHAGVAWAQPVLESPNRVERPTREAPGRALDAERAPTLGTEPPASERRDRQQGQEQQRGQRERDQAQRERTDQAPTPRVPQEQRRDEQLQRDQAQRERQDDRNSRKSPDQAQPDNRTPRSPGTAQPQRPENGPGTPSTAQPAPKQDDQQRPAANAQPDVTQPGATSPQRAQNRTSPSVQGSDNAQAGAADNQRIADTVRQSVERNQVRPIQNLGVSVSVGAELPSRVQLQPLPSEIATIRPQYRDYRYTVSEREIVIVDPRSRRIVEVIDRGGGGRGGSIDIYAAFEHRRDVRRWNRPDTVAFRKGVVLPVGAPYHDLPDEIIERHPDWRGYQYVMTESEEVAIVEPRTRRIVEVVDKNAPRTAAATPVGTGAAASSAPSNGTTDRHELARMILADARPGEIQGIDGLKGAVLPTQVALRPLPAEVEQQDQQLRGFHYALIGDDVLIVDAKSREIVDVIE